MHFRYTDDTPGKQGQGPVGRVDRETGSILVLPVGTVAKDPGFYRGSVSITRPADTNQYTAGDVLSTSASAGTVKELTNIGLAGSRIAFTKATMRIDVGAVPSGMGNFRWHFFDAAPTAINDNAAFNVPAGDRAKYLGYVEIVTPEDLGDTLWSQVRPNVDDFKLAEGSTSLWVIPETRATFIPTSGAVYNASFEAVPV